MKEEDELLTAAGSATEDELVRHLTSSIGCLNSQTTSEVQFGVHEKENKAHQIPTGRQLIELKAQRS